MSVLTCPAWNAERAKNVILFLGDAGGLSTLHAASIHAYGEPGKLYVQRMASLALSETSSAADWVTDSAAGMTAIVTGVKTKNGVISQTADATLEQDGAPLKTILEYAEEHGLSTGVISNSPMADATPAACYAHASSRKKTGEIFAQILTPRFGNGVDLVLGPGRKAILAATQALSVDLAAELPKKGYYFGDTLASIPATSTRAVVLSDDSDFDIAAATELAIRILSRNKKGFFLMVESDLHTSRIDRGLTRAAKFDRLIQTTAENMHRNTLVMFTADHSFDLRISGRAARGDALFTTFDGKPVPARFVTVPGHHSAEHVLVGAEGPGAERVRGFLSNTDLFHIMMAAYGWTPVEMTESRSPGTVRR
ncbi:MAG TPA: alkaline phosphatase [Bryobacteraceae bacterium]|nr:alkaline phosphatase [Bryobacteraceae bacterium]